MTVFSSGWSDLGFSNDESVVPTLRLNLPAGSCHAMSKKTSRLRFVTKGRRVWSVCRFPREGFCHGFRYLPQIQRFSQNVVDARGQGVLGKNRSAVAADQNNRN